MRDILIRLFTDFNAFLIRVTHGRLGSQLGSQRILILHTHGRRSGEIRSTPIAYFEYEDKYLLVASNWGREKHADWYLNLKKQPNATVDIKGRTLRVKARFAEGEEYVGLWEYVTNQHPHYLDYKKMTSRYIPLVILNPA